MPSAERTRELAILISVGMRKGRLITVSIIESLFLAFIGIISGIIGSIPIVWYFHINPIKITGDAAKTFDSLGIEAVFNFSVDFNLFINQAIIVFIITLIAALYPVLFIWKMKPIEAMHS